MISHILLNNLVYQEMPMSQRWLAIAFGVLPDILAFIGVSKMSFLKKILFFKRMPKDYFPKFVFVIYNITHSFIIWGVVFAALYLLAPTWIMIAWTGWGLHIFVDIFTHSSKATLATRIFWPISKFYFDGIVWSNKWFLLVSYAIMALLYWIFYF